MRYFYAKNVELGFVLSMTTFFVIKGNLAFLNILEIVKSLIFDLFSFTIVAASCLGKGHC